MHGDRSPRNPSGHRRRRRGTSRRATRRSIVRVATEAHRTTPTTAGTWAPRGDTRSEHCPGHSEIEELLMGTLVDQRLRDLQRGTRRRNEDQPRVLASGCGTEPRGVMSVDHREQPDVRQQIEREFGRDAHCQLHTLDQTVVRPFEVTRSAGGQQSEADVLVTMTFELVRDATQRAGKGHTRSTERRRAARGAPPPPQRSRQPRVRRADANGRASNAFVHPGPRRGASGLPGCPVRRPSDSRHRRLRRTVPPPAAYRARRCRRISPGVPSALVRSP